MMSLASRTLLLRPDGLSTAYHKAPPNTAQQATIAPKLAIVVESQRRWAAPHYSILLTV